MFTSYVVESTFDKSVYLTLEEAEKAYFRKCNFSNCVEMGGVDAFGHYTMLRSTF